MFENKNNRSEISSLGEFGLIDHITKNVKLHHKSSKLGVGDDAAVIDSDKQIVVSTDMLTEGVHFDLTYVPLKHLGYKAVVVNLSDIYAMNATPTQVTVSIAFSNRFSVEAIEELYNGILTACNIYNVDLVGGDTTSSTSGLVISVTAIGEVEKDKYVTRKGAKNNDLIVVSGDLGGAYMGLQILEREKHVFQENPKIQPDLDGNDYILERQLKPEARKDAIEQLKGLEIQPTSMIDISDGLASEIFHICKSSEVGCNLFEDKIPIDQQTYDRAREFELDPTMTALNGGEDYELLFTVDLGDFEKLKNNPYFTVIGHITEAKNYTLTAKDGTVVPLKAQGWDHFNKEN